jgi:hypothetical protein
VDRDLEAHAADVAHAQALVAIFVTDANLLKDGNIQGAQAMKHALDAIHELRKPFEMESQVSWPAHSDPRPVT